MSGPRDYTGGTERALFRLARGTCYYPDCMASIILVVDDEAVVAVETAHIRGALRDSARYDAAMTDEERRAFANLLLLCTAHHKLVDRLKPAENPPELLER
jgi:predicted restriction endonuclease